MKVVLWTALVYKNPTLAIFYDKSRDKNVFMKEI